MLGKADHEVKGMLPLKHARHRDALHSRLEGVGGIFNHHPVLRHGFPVKTHAQDRDVELLLD